jgi:photosystem II stability/assembly factor-like uncharacterized protein
MPGGPFRALHVTVDPSNAHTLYAGTYGYGLFRSTDAGATWSEANAGMHSVGINAIAIDPVLPRVIFAGTNSLGVFKSTDAGATWNRLSDGYAGGGLIRAVAIAPTSPTQSLYATDLNSGVFVSPDSGVTWGRARWFRPFPGALAFHPEHAEIAYASAVGGGVFKSTNGGQSWTAVNTGLDNLDTDGLILDPANPETIFVAAGQAIYRSDNAAQTWTRMRTSFRSRALAISSQGSAKGTWYAGGGGMFKSTDAGHTWTAIADGLPSPVLIRSLAVDPSHPEVVYAGTEGSGLYKTGDGGKSWHLTGAAATALK